VQVYAEALRSNALLQARVAEAEGGTQAVEQARGRLMPQVGLRGSYEAIDERVSGDYYGVVDVDSHEDYTRGLVGVRLTQALYRPDLSLDLDQAELRRTQKQLQLDADEDELLIGVASAYFGVLAARDAVRFTQAEQDAVRQVFEQVSTRYSAGLSTEADFQGAKAQQSLGEARLAEAKGELDAAWAALDLVAGQPFRQLKVLPEGMVLTRPEPAEANAWAERARLQNPQVLAAQLDVRLAAGGQDKARSLRLPRLDLAVGGFFLDSGGGITGERDETEGRVGVELNLPLYTGGSVSAAIAQAEAGTDRAEALLLAARAQAERDARVAYQKSIAGLSQVPALKDALVAARSAESATRAGFEAGTRTDADVLRAVQQRYETERDYSAARYRFMLDSLRLKQAAGDLTNADLSRFDRVLRAESELAP
jgi:outer membrane protein